MTRTMTTVIAVFALASGVPARQEPTTLDVRPAELVPRNMQLVQGFQPYASPAGSGTGKVWETAVPRTIPVGGRIRIHIRVAQADPTAKWRVVVTDERGNEVETIDGGVLATAKEWWSDEVPTPRGHVQLWVDSAPPHPRIVVDAYMFQVRPATNQGTVGEDNTKWITDGAVPAHVRGQSRPVARLRFVVPDGEGLCTGFLVGASLLMTNEHCISNDAQAPGALVEFNYDSEGMSTKRYRILKVEAADFGLDYALVRLSGEVTGQSRMFLDPTASTTGTRLYVIQHPEGKPKRAAFWPNCNVEADSVFGRAATQTDFKHVCDTKPGSSGAPVLHWTSRKVVGLHHLGYPKGREDLVNQAVHIRDVIDDLRKKAASGALAKEVLDEVLRSQ